MRLSRLLARIGLVGLVGLIAYAAVPELLRPAEAKPTEAPPPSRFSLIVKTAAVTIAAGLILALLGGVAFAFSGVYDLAAGKPHTRPVAWSLKTMMIRGVRLHAIGVSVPGSADAALLNHGFTLYRVNCRPYHGAPGIAPQIGLGINPKPPRLEETASQCHLVPEAGRGSVGPPLTAFAERTYIAGIIVNPPSNAIRWIVDPQQSKPGTAMPNTGVPERDAADIVAYLYRLGDPRRLVDLQEHGCRP